MYYLKNILRIKMFIETVLKAVLKNGVKLKHQMQTIITLFISLNTSYTLY
jgi:hypothetical protein